MRFFVPKRFVTTGKTEPFTLRKSRALPWVVDHTAMDLGDLKIRIDLGRDLDDLVLAAKRIDKCAKVSMHKNRFAREIRER